MKKSAKPIIIEESDIGYSIKFNTPEIGEGSYHSIESIVQKAIQEGKRVYLDLTSVGYANGDFFNCLVAQYISPRQNKRGRTAAIKYMRRNLTLAVDPESKTYSCAYALWHNLLNYEFRRHKKAA